LAKLKEKVNAAKYYCPPIKRHEIKQNNPFFNGALGFKGLKSPPKACGSDDISIDKMFGSGAATSVMMSNLTSVRTANILSGHNNSVLGAQSVL